MSINSLSHSFEEEPISGLISKLDDLENTISHLELDVRNELHTQRLLDRCELNLAARCADPSETDAQGKRLSGESIPSTFGECSCRCSQALAIYLEQLRQAKLEQEQLLRHLKMREEQLQLYRSKMLETNAIVEHQKEQIRALVEKEKMVTEKINFTLEEENQTLMQEINQLKRLPDELRVRERALRDANKELQETKLTLKSLLLDIETGLETCEDISGELQQERTRAFQTMTEIDQEKRKVITWVAKYSELKQQYESALQQKESVDQLVAELREKSLQLDQMTKKYEAIKEESSKYLSKVESEYSQQEKKLNKRVVDLECENQCLKVKLNDQSFKTSDTSHKMHLELLSLEQKFKEAQEEISALKRFNEATAAAAEYVTRKKQTSGNDSDSPSLSPPFCSMCAVETSERLKSLGDICSSPYQNSGSENDTSDRSLEDTTIPDMLEATCTFAFHNLRRLMNGSRPTLPT
ncbi:centrosomal protein of 135 kDa-like [Wyeomyia smithii]|uniref:centrosomal protein of 135 kDa-like n=1 Tax=Wyeomyia smithii TaxID=174621 RepID=UPI002467AD19|nr:centrosomal protein of 135 kDa-like [Wyeomyia smithii]